MKRNLLLGVSMLAILLAAGFAAYGLLLNKGPEPLTALRLEQVKKSLEDSFTIYASSKTEDLTQDSGATGGVREPAIDSTSCTESKALKNSAGSTHQLNCLIVWHLEAGDGNASGGGARSKSTFAVSYREPESCWKGLAGVPQYEQGGEWKKFASARDENIEGCLSQLTLSNDQPAPTAGGDSEAAANTFVEFDSHDILQEPAQFTQGNAESYENLDWTGWGGSTTTAIGRYVAQTCDPDCATGPRITYQLKVTLSDPKTCGKRRYYQAGKGMTTDENGKEQSFDLAVAPC